MVLETSVFAPSDHSTRLVAGEGFYADLFRTYLQGMRTWQCDVGFRSVATRLAILWPPMMFYCIAVCLLQT